jgi:hypothetical protein
MEVEILVDGATHNNDLDVLIESLSTKNRNQVRQGAVNKIQCLCVCVCVFFLMQMYIICIVHMHGFYLMFYIFLSKHRSLSFSITSCVWEVISIGSVGYLLRHLK